MYKIADIVPPCLFLFCFVLLEFHAFFRELYLDFGLLDIGGGMPSTKKHFFIALRFIIFICEATLCVLVALVNLYADLGENTFIWIRVVLQLKAQT